MMNDDNSIRLTKNRSGDWYGFSVVVEGRGDAHFVKTDEM